MDVIWLNAPEWGKQQQQQTLMLLKGHDHPEKISCLELYAVIGILDKAEIAL